jgi:hypothetical protein
MDHPSIFSIPLSKKSLSVRKLITYLNFSFEKFSVFYLSESPLHQQLKTKFFEEKFCGGPDRDRTDDLATVG